MIDWIIGKPVTRERQTIEALHVIEVQNANRQGRQVAGLLPCVGKRTRAHHFQGLQRRERQKLLLEYQSSALQEAERVSEALNVQPCTKQKRDVKRALPIERLQLLWRKRKMKA